MLIIEKLIFKETSVHLILSNSEKLKISYDLYYMYKISGGMDLSSEQYMELYDESKKFECIEKALSRLSVRGYSVDELYRSLKKKNFSEKHIKETLEYMKTKGYLNDYNYSMNFVKDKIRSGKYGKNLIVRDLYKKGIDRNTVKKVIKESGADITNDDELYRLAMKKYISLKDKDNPFVKVSNYLLNRGFDYESINRILRQIKKDTESYS
ncbi:MAG: recombination regulator RecX [Leptospirales bacterium]|nr:recombination regulator RecX [Leptospirales bacterium]